MDPASTAGVDGFLAGLRRCGLEPVVRGAVVTFAVEAPPGPRAGTVVETGVETAELTAWPAVPPHWVHLCTDITFARTNADATECLPGWVRHSRQIAGWGDAAEPAQAWLAHVRGVLAEAA